jgi:hypothetical protein
VMPIRLHNSYSYPCAGPDSQDTNVNYCSATDRMVFVHCFKPIVVILVYFVCTQYAVNDILLLIKIKYPSTTKSKGSSVLLLMIGYMDVLGRAMSRRLTPQRPCTTDSICALHEHLLHAKIFIKRKSQKTCTLVQR